VTADSNSQFRAQFGEDRLLDDYFEHKRAGFFVEIGAYNGVDFSNTYYFEQNGWRGLLVEPDAEEAANCRASRPRSRVIECAAVGPESVGEVTFQVVPGWRALSARAVSRRRAGEELVGSLEIEERTVPARTIDSILQEVEPPEIDFVTIDVEGGEWDVLRGFSLPTWKPQVVIIERAEALPDRRILDHMHRHRYAYLRTTGSINDWFVRLAPEAALWTPLYTLKFWLSLYLPGIFLDRVAFPVKRAIKKVLALIGLEGPVRRLLGRPKP